MTFERLPILKYYQALLLCTFASAPFGLVAETVSIHVRVLDGGTGHNLSGLNLAFVDYHTDHKGGHREDLNGRTPVQTSADGDLYSAEPDAQGLLAFNGMGIGGAWTPCTRQPFYDRNRQTYGSDYLYPVSTIIASGL